MALKKVSWHDLNATEQVISTTNKHRFTNLYNESTCKQTLKIVKHFEDSVCT